FLQPMVELAEQWDIALPSTFEPSRGARAGSKRASTGLWLSPRATAPPPALVAILVLRSYPGATRPGCRNLARPGLRCRCYYLNFFNSFNFLN
ncbi:MAG: hypothetical protein J6J93_11105, partial [Muribaculaceae bacterium]|nr:hypothetical protein [Muribaculaceae bacterium]